MLIRYCHKWVGSGRSALPPEPNLFQASGSNHVLDKKKKKNTVELYASDALHGD